jgi:hypothetical protein
MTNLPLPYDPLFAAWQTVKVGRVIAIDDWIDDVIDPFMGRPLYFDRQARPISMTRWGELRETGLDPDGHYGARAYLRVGEDRIGEVTVSTVWLGIDHGFCSFTEREALGEAYQPVIFETMIFGGQYSHWQRRYCTEAQAARGHLEAVTDVRAGMKPWWAYGGCEEDEWRMDGRDG